ncbi:hypothetical protein, partial [Pseudomonas veronii]|uniref:hypothetical protein n=1 Tax=Pseudomonas veronii TaxID=76761 RepID=UPI001E51FC4E
MTDPLVGESCQTIEGRVERSCTILQFEESDTKAFSRHCQGSTEDHLSDRPKQNPCLHEQTGVLEFNLDDDLLSHGETP